MQFNLVEKYNTYLLLEKSFSAHTVSAYMRDLQKLTDFLQTHNVDYTEVTYDHLHEFVAQIQQSGLTARSQARITSGIRSFYKFLHFTDKMNHDPSELLELPNLGVHFPEVLSVEEIDNIIAAIDLSDPQGHRNRAIVETLYSCGVRVSELVGLRLSCIFFEEHYIRVFGKGSKERIVPISDTAIKYIQQWLEDRRLLDIKPGNEDILFLNRYGRQLTRAMIFHLIKEFSEEAGIKKNISPHTFRHSFATHLMLGGANLRIVQELLGHESITTTEIYTHMDTSYLRDTIQKFHPRNKK